jgi:hypothetical protein
VNEPRSDAMRDSIERFYRESIQKRRHNFQAGRGLAGALESQGFHVSTTELTERELAFDGPASPKALAAWCARFASMQGMKSFFGAGLTDFADRSMRVLKSPRIRALCEVVCYVGKRG